jgi:AraC-like DNA-binding protein
LAFLELVPPEEKPMSATLTVAAPAGLPSFDSALVARLLAEALTILDNDRANARRHIERAYVLAQGETVTTAAKGLLADWQVRRVDRFIVGHIATPLRIRDAAACVNLSAGYFSRAFKASKGVPYSEYVTAKRVTLAKQLLLTTHDPIAEIALACGFSDQSHLTRLFRATVGVPPGTWRRNHEHDPADRSELAA